jgi:GntR family transcriptional regulator
MPLDVTEKTIAKERPAFSEKHGTLYAQVANVFRQRIRAGQWSAGDQLPTLDDLEVEFQVARVTLRHLDADAEEDAPYLEPGDGDAAPAYRHMRRVHGRGERSYAVVDMHLDAKLYSRAPKRFDKEMIIPVIEKMRGVEIADIRQTLTIGTADAPVADGLGVPIGSPIGILRRVVCDAKGRAIYVGIVNYRGDAVKLDITLATNKEASL